LGFLGYILFFWQTHGGCPALDRKTVWIHYREKWVCPFFTEGSQTPKFMQNIFSSTLKLLAINNRGWLRTKMGKIRSNFSNITTLRVVINLGQFSVVCKSADTCLPTPLNNWRIQLTLSSRQAVIAIMHLVFAFTGLYEYFIPEIDGVCVCV
jgi:hypothetical protein